MGHLRRAMMLLAIALAAPGCGGDDVPPAGAVDAAVAACALPTTTVTCTVGDDAPCTASCATAYCYNFSQLPTPVCTKGCTPGSTTECPTGWTCNNMGRCRPP